MAQTGWKEKDDRTIAQMRDYMEREGLDAFIPSKTEHIAYLLNYWDIVHTSILWEERTALLVVPARGEAIPHDDAQGARATGKEISIEGPWVPESRDATTGHCQSLGHGIRAVQCGRLLRQPVPVPGAGGEACVT